VRAAVVVASNRAAAGVYEDSTGPLIVAALQEAGFTVEPPLVVPDGEPVGDAIRAAIAGGARAVLTTGGTGLTPTDITPEATRAVIDREAPGFAETMRAEGLKHTPHGILTRGVSGIAGRTLIVNFPGSPKSIEQLFPVLAPTLKHVVRTLRGDSSHHESDRAG
jgi:molybdopterin adenylyltransferase